jgi:hypothetical protein
MKQPIPLKNRPLDFIYIGFFAVNLLVITYIIDLEQLVVKDVHNFTYPFWPPAFMIDLVHWWGNTFDPLLMARPPFWKATIWLDVVVFGPFYLFALYAFIKGKDWIRVPTLVVMPILFTNVFIICSEEIWGISATGNLPMVLFANAAWFLFPVFLIWKMWKNPNPFTKELTN